MADNAFGRAPSNPYTENAKQNHDAIYGQQQQAEQAPQAQQQTVQQVQPTVQQPQQVVQPIQQPAMQQPVQQRVDPYSQPEYQQLAQQYTQLQQQYQQSQQQLDAYNAAQRQAQIQNAISADAFNDLETIDADDAKKISDKVLGATSQSLDEIRKEIAAQRDLITRTAGQAREGVLEQEVLRVHPDFYDIVKTDDYNNFIQQRDGLSSKTRGQRLLEEFTAGNTAYVIDVLNQFKTGRPSIQSITSVAPVQTPTYASAAAGSPQQPQYTLRELNDLYQTRQISHEKFREELSKIRAAQS